MGIDSAFLKLIVCPKTRQKLSYASEDILKSVNKAIDQGRVNTANGQVISEYLDAGLITSDGSLIYPVRQGIPHLLIDEGIVVSDNLKV